MSEAVHLTLKEVRKRYILTILRDSAWDLKKASLILGVTEGFLRREVRKMRMAGRRIGPKGERNLP